MTSFKKVRTLPVLIVLILSGACLDTGGGDGEADSPGVWIDTEWSKGKYRSASNVEADASPGELLLAQDVSAPVEIFSAQDPEGIQRGLYDLEVYNGKLYMASATTPGTKDGGDIFSYDCRTDRFEFEYAVHEQGIVQMRAHKGKLYVPGLDSMTPGWQFGNLYIHDGERWLRKETILEAVHVFDVNFYNGCIYVTTGQYEQATGTFQGKVWESDNEGDKWREVSRLDPLPGDYRRFYYMGVYEDKLYIQSDNRPPEGKVLFIYDGYNMDMIPFSPQVERSYGIFLELKGKLFYMDRGWLHIYDGTLWDYVVLPFAGDKYAKAFVVYNGSLYGGADKGILFQSPEGVVWTKAAKLEGDVTEIESLDSYYGRLYMGTSGVEARLFVSASADSGELISSVHDLKRYIMTGFLSWEAISPPGTSVRFKLRSAPSREMISEEPFTGPDGTPDTFYEDSGERLSEAHSGDRFIQYRLILGTDDETLSPIIKEVKIEVN